MSGNAYRDLIADYISANFSRAGLTVYTEVPVGKTIIGKNRSVDVFVLRRSDQRALALECKFQKTGGTADEKVYYALHDVQQMWVPGCVVYGGAGWSKGILHTLAGSRHAAFCEPERPELERTDQTLELDHILGAVFGLWDLVLDSKFLRNPRQLPLPGLAKAKPKRKKPRQSKKKKASS